MSPEDRSTLNSIAELLPVGYFKKIPFSNTSDITFQFNGVNLIISAVYLSKALNCYCFDLHWSADKVIYGIPIRCGIDILKQYTTPLPNLYAYNPANPGAEVVSWDSMELYCIDETVLENG